MKAAKEPTSAARVVPPSPSHYTWVVLDDGEHNYGSEWYRRLIDTTLGCSGI